MELSYFILMAFVVEKAASEWSPLKFEALRLPIVWVDGRYRSDEPPEIDTFFDRVVSISYIDESKEGRKNSNGGIGVFVTNDLVLTSFNAFRKISMEANSMHNMNIYVIITRAVDVTGRVKFYQDVKLSSHKIKCGRQVVPPVDYESRTNDLKHGENSPLHDLMIMRLQEPAEFVIPVPPTLNDFSDYKTWVFDTDKNRYRKGKFSPIKTLLAKPGDTMYQDEMRFASIGHLNDLHIKENRFLEIGQVGAIVDCEEWIPREWGIFICLKNTENYPGLANGAVLFSGDTLFGVGSFTLQRADSSILVFTDVRPYWHLLQRTCTDDDMNFQIPPDLTHTLLITA